MNYLSHIFWITSFSFYISTCCCTLHFDVRETASLLQLHEPVSAGFRLFICSFLTSLSPHWREGSLGFPGGSEVKCLPAMWETWVQSQGREDPLEKEMATHSSTLAWKIPWTKEPGRLQSKGSQRVRHDWATSLQGPVMSGWDFCIWEWYGGVDLLSRPVKLSLYKQEGFVYSCVHMSCTFNFL